MLRQPYNNDNGDTLLASTFFVAITDHDNKMRGCG